jgi:hypothetical protein
LNKKDEHRWTRDMIDKSKIIREDWWHQLCHSWTHYVFGQLSSYDFNAPTSSSRTFHVLPQQQQEVNALRRGVDLGSLPLVCDAAILITTR